MIEIPLRLTITTPSPSPRKRGINSTTPFHNVMHTRCSQQEFNIITAGARVLGITVSEYLRWLGVHAAKELGVKENEDDGP